mgnify:CR=1 FL=1
MTGLISVLLKELRATLRGSRAALLITEAVNIDPSGSPVEYGTSWFCAQRVTLTIAPE